MIKKVAYCLYVHNSNLKELCSVLNEHQQEVLMRVLKRHLEPFAIIKYNIQDNSVSLIQSDDWDIANEPTVGLSVCYKLDGTIKYIKGNTKVYHNKWQFVSSDYTGFSIEKAKIRTQLWNNIPGINELKCKIGSKIFWYKLLEVNNIEI